MLTLLAYGRYVRQPSPARYGLVFAALSAGLLAKPMLVSTPLLLLLLDYWPLRRLAFGRALVEKLPLLGICAAAGAMTLFAQDRGGALWPAEMLSLPGDRVSVKATTTEKMGFTGREEGIAAHAVVLLLERGE